MDASPAITAEERAVALSQPISKPDEDAAPYLSSDLAIDTPYRKTAGTDRDKADSYIERLKKSHKAAAGPAGKRGKGKSLGIAG